MLCDLYNKYRATINPIAKIVIFLNVKQLELSNSKIIRLISRGLH